MILEKQLIEFAKTNYIPIILDDSKEFMINLCKENSFKNILEIGTAIGYSGSILLENCKDAHLTTIELNKNSFNIAKQTFEKENLKERVTQIFGDAKEVIKTLENESYDFIFLDGPKGQYFRYLPTLIKLLKKDGILFSDNIYFKGMVKKEGFIEKKHRTIVNNLRKYISLLKESNELITTFYDIGDGISVSKKL